MALTFKQLAGTAATAEDACNANDYDVAATAKKWNAQVDGSTTGTQYQLTVPGLATGHPASVVLLAQWESSGPEYGNPGETVTWEAGRWICRVNVTQANSSVFWDTVEICAKAPGGATTAVASVSNMGTALSSTGTYSTTITVGSPVTVTAGSTILWSYYFGQSIATGAGQLFKIRSNKNLSTPIENKRGVAVVDMATAVVLPGTTFGAISVSAPIAGVVTEALAPSPLLKEGQKTWTWRGVVAQGAAVASSATSGAAARVLVNAGAMEAQAVCSGSVTRSQATSSGVLVGAASGGLVERGTISTATFEEKAIVTGRSVKAAMAKGGLEAASVSEAMTERSVLVSGGPEAVRIS
jgi:hypothetical protein